MRDTIRKIFGRENKSSVLFWEILKILHNTVGGITLNPVRGFSQNRISQYRYCSHNSELRTWKQFIFSVSGNDDAGQIRSAKSNIQIKPCGGEEGDDDGRRERAVRKLEYELYVERK